VQLAETGSFDIELVAVDAAGNTSEARHRLSRSVETTDGPNAGCSGGSSGLPMGFALLALVGLVALRRTSTAGRPV
jgi:MYXO-CTERM domain-containing protein